MRNRISTRVIFMLINTSIKGRIEIEREGNPNLVFEMIEQEEMRSKNHRVSMIHGDIVHYHL